MIINGDSAKALKKFEDNSIDAVITDPPYGIEFLGKEWDSNTGAIDIWQECLRVLKPGGFLLAFSAARTYHHLATNIEQVGFEIKDQLIWIYSSGMPKGQDIGKASNSKWQGWRTALKPAQEPIVMARKTFKDSTLANMERWGVGALNIDENRIPYEDEKDYNVYVNNIKGPLERSTAKAGDKIGMFSGQTGFKAQKGKVGEDFIPNQQGRYPSNVLGEITNYQRYFYCPKVTKKEKMSFNTHPTVKPVELMKYLIKLVAPKGAHILDPFAGSGSTGMACKQLGYRFTGIDLDANYCDIAERRIAATQEDLTETLFEEQT